MAFDDLKTSFELQKAKWLFWLQSKFDPKEHNAGRALYLDELEERVLLSASPMMAVGDGAAATEIVHVAPVDPSGGSAVEGESTQDSVFDSQHGQQLLDEVASEFGLEVETSVRRELVFVDTSVEDFQQLLDDLWSNDDSSREFEVVLLQNSRDGIEQISEALSDRSELDAVHFVTHGTEGRVKLGGTWLDVNNLGGYAGEVAGWSGSLTADADLLFYGCDLAGSDSGQELIDSLSVLTGADVAASTDDTGHSIFGADWELEYSAGQIETQIAFSQDVQANWGHLMNVAVDATSTGTTTGSSITISHTTSGTDRLMLVGATTYVDNDLLVFRPTTPGD